jgi:hypothetical protein
VSDLSPTVKTGSDPISDYLAVMTGALPVGGEVGATTEREVERVRAGLQELTRYNAGVRARKLVRRERIGRAFRLLTTAIVVTSVAWLAGNAIGYATATTRQRPVVVDDGGLVPEATVVLGDGTVARADCWADNATATVFEAPPGIRAIVPYRCGSSALGALIAGPLSAAAFALGVVGSGGLLLAGLRRRRRAHWY